ncbi:transcriptional regulator, Fis family [Leptospira ryugenii]|uniref:Transcriptional regulator, Fis family n=1 Tax=Leptospira ryugenii TaxID=1917863 RepID=A0A2P2E340_9LEPT|nr:helix-turn-helix domain-containing protein [Leptospira ryugenii]GBF51325.1 transcriptional regulator, Fis family [Leptospira ryugenii]
MSKKGNESDWIAEDSHSKIAKLNLIELSKSQVPIVMVGRSGCGKSYWIDKSLELKGFLANKAKYIFDGKESFDLSLKEFKEIKPKNPSTVIFRNFHLADTWIADFWIRWWEETKYDLPENFHFYWELPGERIENQNENSKEKQLYSQLQAFQIKIPSLSERPADLPLFLNVFLEEANRKLKKSILGFDEDCLYFFTSNAKHFNLHDLKELVYSLVAFCTSKRIQLQKFPIHLFKREKLKVPIQSGIKLDLYEKLIIQENLKVLNGNRAKVAEILGISERNLYRKIKEYHLEDE